MDESIVNSFKLAKYVCSCLSDGYDDPDEMEEAEIALYNELSQISSDSPIRVALFELCERVEELEEG